MIVYDLRCGGGHVFEAWFGSAGDFDAQQAGGLVTCPLCDDSDVARLPSAPAIGGRSGAPAMGDAAEAKAALTALAKAQARALEGSEYVGRRFAKEARAIHHGEAEARGIHGEARLAEARALAEEGIAALPLLFAVRPQGHDA